MKFEEENEFKRTRLSASGHDNWEVSRKYSVIYYEDTNILRKNYPFPESDQNELFQKFLGEFSHSYTLFYLFANEIYVSA